MAPQWSIARIYSLLVGQGSRWAQSIFLSIYWRLDGCCRRRRRCANNLASRSRRLNLARTGRRAPKARNVMLKPKRKWLPTRRAHDISRAELSWMRAFTVKSPTGIIAAPDGRLGSNSRPTGYNLAAESSDSLKVHRLRKHKSN